VFELFLERAPGSAGAFLHYVDEGRLTGASFVRAVRPGNDQGAPPITVVQVRRIHQQGTLTQAPDPYLKGQMLAEPIAIHSIHREAPRR
jgi:cyclophilin family peptidyl-prolyl cis-trans isomerase